MKIGFIGAGKVGTAFGLYMKDCGHTIVGYVSKHFYSAQESAERTKSVAYADVASLLLVCDVVLITTPDTQIEGVLQANRTSIKESSCGLGHMSGALTSDIFQDLSVSRALFTLHPLQAFATVDKGRQDLKTCTFVMEGNAQGINLAKKLMDRCDNKLITLRKEDKALYHGAACVASNYLMVVTALAEEMINSFDPEGHMGLGAYRNLMVGAIDNAIAYGSKTALTGPIARGDLETIRQHLGAMENEQMKKDYSTLGMMTVKLASKEKLTDPVLREQFTKVLLF
jgi:predicted short-subunit dehydrogenase-like oxidoreductase (DUF2520 family)